jgi:hypothetical protein
MFKTKDIKSLKKGVGSELELGQFFKIKNGKNATYRPRALLKRKHDSFKVFDFFVFGRT